MSTLTGYGGSISIDNATAAIGEWIIHRYINPGGLKGWNGRATLEEKIILPGEGKGNFKKDNKTYSGSIIITHVPLHWSKSTGASPVIIDFQGSGALIES
jgi:hypothetical protein